MASLSMIGLSPSRNRVIFFSTVSINSGAYRDNLSNFVRYSCTVALPCMSCWNSIAFCLLTCVGTYLSPNCLLKLAQASASAMVLYSALIVFHHMSARPVNNEAVSCTCCLPVHLNISKMFSVCSNQSSAASGSSCPVNSLGPLFLNFSYSALGSCSLLLMTI